MSIAGLALSIVSCFITFWGVVAILGIVFSCIGLSKPLPNGKKNRLAIAGLIIGIISICYTYIYLLVIMKQL